jgi:undecaprenyl-diphosphatase
MDILKLILPHFNHWGYYLLFLMTFLETSAFLGLLVPGESVVVIAGLLAARGTLNLGDAIWVASLGAIFGDTTGYFIGRRFGEGFFLKYGRRFFFNKEYLDDTKLFFEKHGGKTVFLGRFMSWLRAFAPVVAGISKMNYPRFLFFNVAGGIAWAVVFTLLGYFAGNSWEMIRGYLGLFGVFAFICSAVAIFLYFFLTKRRRLIRGKTGWIDGQLSSRMPGTWDFIKGRFSAGEWYGVSLTTGILLLVFTLYSFGEIVEDLVDKETLFYLDFRIQHFMERIITPDATRLMVDVTNFGGVYLAAFVAGAAALYLLHKRRWWELFTLFWVVGGGETALFLLKHLFHRPRPTRQLVAAYGYSFPSGHAFSAVAVYGFLIYLTWKLANNGTLKLTIFTTSILLILLIGISRIYLNVHWLTDVLGGYAAGFSWLAFCVIMANTIKQYYKKSP